MKRKQTTIWIISLTILLSMISTTTLNTQSLAKNNVNNSTTILSNTDLKIQIFANKRFITQGDSINITYGVYNDNYTYQSNIVVVFGISGIQFTKLSTSHLNSFFLQINQTYSKVSLLATIYTDQQEIDFYGISQKPTCQSSCTQALLNATQLQVFTGFSTTMRLSIITDVQFFEPTDMIEVRMPGEQLTIFVSSTNVSYFNTQPSFTEYFTLPVNVPIINPGSYSFQFLFYSNYYYPVNITRQFTVASSSISYTITNTTVDRLNIGESPKDFITYQFNFSIANFQYSYFISNNRSIAYSATGQISNVLLKLPIVVNFVNPVGTYFLNIELSKNNLILYTRMVQIIVYDNIITDLIFNNILSDNQLTINFQLNTYIEDTLDNIPTTVNILNADTNITLKTISVEGIQYFNLSFTNVTVIPTRLLVLTNSNYSLYHTHTRYYPIYYKDATNISSNYDQNIQVDRLQQLHIMVWVTDSQTNTSVTNGLVNLNIDGETILSLQLNVTNIFTYIIPVDTTVGLHSLTLDYLGTNSYFSSSCIYELDIYSNVHFANVMVNNTFTNPTTPILVNGSILDENDAGIITRVVIIDSNNTIIDSTVTNVEGEFSFIILNSNIMGYYNYELKALTVNYYKSAEYYFNLLQNNAFSVDIQANETMSLANISVKGNIYGTYQLSYFTAESSSYNLSLLNLDSNGEIQTNFLTPNIIGPVYFNVTNLQDLTQMWVQKFILYKIPHVTIQQLNNAFVGKTVNVSIQSDVVYRLFFNDQLVNNQLVYINRTILSLNVDTKGINVLKLEFTSHYITVSQITKEIFVYEQVHLIQTIPTKINENTNVTVYLQVLNNLNLPLGNVAIEFLYKGTVIFNKTTDNKGYLLSYITIKDALENYNFRILGNTGQYILQQDFSVNTTLIRTLIVTTNINSLKFNDLTPTVVSFTVLYQGTNQPAPLVNMTIEIIDQQQKKDDYSVKTSNNGIITIQISKPIGIYVLTILTSDPNFIMAKSVYTFQVKGFDVINNPFVVPSLLLGGLGILVIIKKKVLFK